MLKIKTVSYYLGKQYITESILNSQFFSRLVKANLPVGVGVTLESFCFIAVFNIPARSGIFRYNSCSFRSGVIPFYSRVMSPPCSSIFHFIPVYSVPFRSIPFLCFVLTPHFELTRHRLFCFCNKNYHSLKQLL